MPENPGRFHEASAASRGVVSGRLVFGLAVLAFGILTTLDNLDLIHSGDVIQWWGALPLGWGLAKMLGWAGPRQLAGGGLWALVGAIALLRAADVIPVGVSDLWPLLLVYVGANIVFRSWSGAARPWGQGTFTEAGDTVRTFGLMSGNDHKIVSQSFRGGSVDAMMAGVTLDLRSAGLSEGKAAIELFAMWGGIEIVVPQGWRIQAEVTPIMGGFEDSTIQPSDPDAPTLVLRGFVVMGGVEVSHTSDDRPGSGGVIVKVGRTAGLAHDDSAGRRPSSSAAPVDPE